MSTPQLPSDQRDELLNVLKARFEKNPHRHKGVDWTDVRTKLEAHPEGLWTLKEMDRTGGEPDVVTLDPSDDAITFCDCAAQSPTGRRSLCFDQAALESRKEHKPAGSAVGMAQDMGVELLTEEQYRQLQTLGEFDLKTSSWIATPPEIRKLGGAIFADRRYDRVFVYHNGAESYYASRGFRGLLRI